YPGGGYPGGGYCGGGGVVAAPVIAPSAPPVAAPIAAPVPPPAAAPIAAPAPAPSRPPPTARWPGSYGFVHEAMPSTNARAGTISALFIEISPRFSPTLIGSRSEEHTS